MKRFLVGAPPAKREAQLGVARVRRFEPVTRRPVLPTPAEIARNPRAASAKLRVARRVAA